MSGRPFFTQREAILRSDLPATTKLVLLVLSVYTNDLGKSISPSIEKLAAGASLSKRTVVNHLREAAAMGWAIDVKYRAQGQRRRANSIAPQGEA